MEDNQHVTQTEPSPERIDSQPKAESVCAYCGTPLSEGQVFCPKCGNPKKNTEFCSKCSTELMDGQIYCPRCGQKREPEPLLPSGIRQSNKKSVKPHSKSLFIGIIIISVLLLIAIIVTVVLLIHSFHDNESTPNPDFRLLYKEYCSSKWADVGKDGSYLFIDTNPYNEEDNGLAYPAADTAIQEINQELGLPNYLYSEIIHTTSLDGVQSYEFPEQGVIVSWKYHPDLGLEITYKKYNKKS